MTHGTLVQFKPAENEISYIKEMRSEMKAILNMAWVYAKGEF